MTQVYIPRAHARFQRLGYSSFAMVFILQACSSAIFQQAFYYFIFDLFFISFSLFSLHGIRFQAERRHERCNVFCYGSL